MNVLIVDDHVLFCQAMKTLLNVLAPALELDMAADVREATQQVADHTYELVLLDWNLADCSGEEAINALRQHGCAARIVIVTADTSAETVARAMEAGAAGYIPKTYDGNALLAALEVVIDGGIFLPPEARPSPGAGPLPARAGSPSPGPSIASRLSELTPRQTAVYHAAARGLPNKMIARELGIAESTVKTHLSVIYSVLGVNNRTQAAWQASHEGIRVGQRP